MPAPSSLVHQTTTTTGTGALTLTDANGKRSFLTAFGTGGTDTFDYFISHQSAAEWEIGTGHESSGTLVRDTVITSSNSNNAVNFSAGTKDVTNDIPAASQTHIALAQTFTAAKTFPQTGLKVQDSDASHSMILKNNENQTADRTLSLVMGDANRTLTFYGSPIVGAGTRRAITGTDTVATTDHAGLIEITSGTFTLAFTAAATLANGFYTTIFNNGTGVVTLDPDSTEQIDGLTTWKLYPGGAIKVFCTGSALESVLLKAMVATFDSDDTFTTPGVGTYALLEAWGGGGSGGKGATNAPAGGAGGGGYNYRWMLKSGLGATETIDIGAGGAGQTTGSTAGNAGNNTTIGSLLTGYGGGGGGVLAGGGGGGGGGGMRGAGTSATVGAGGNGGLPQHTTNVGAGMAADSATTTVADNQCGGGGGGGGSTSAAAGYRGGASFYGGGGGAGGQDGVGTAGNMPGGASTWGGGGGGGAANSSAGGTGGVSLYGGSGSNGAVDAGTSSAGTQPGGGSGGTEGGNSGDGGAGRVRITIF